MKKNNIVFVFSYEFKKPNLSDMPQSEQDKLTEEEKEKAKQLLGMNENNRYINLFSIPFSSIEADSATIKAMIVVLRNKLAIGANIEGNKLLKLFGDCFKNPKCSHYHKPVLKDVMCIDTNDFNNVN